jgi:DNA-binding IclR family transcriptional regulator
VKGLKPPAPRLDFNEWPSSLPSHDIWTPGQTVNLSPLAKVRERGQFENVAKSAVRALDVIELLARSRRPLRAVEIAGALQLSASSTHQLLKSMMDAAYLLFDPASKQYRPSLRSGRMGASLGELTFGAHALDALITALQERLEGRFALSAFQGSFMQIVDVFAPEEGGASRTGQHELRRASIGLRVPVFGSCTGAAWLSVQSDEDIKAVARRCRRALGHDLEGTDQLLEIARRTRSRGYAFGGVSPDDTTRAIAVPLPRDASGIVYVLAMSAPTEGVEGRRDEIAETMITQILAHPLTGGTAA